MIMWFLFWSYHIQTHSCRLLYLGKKTTLAQIHTFLQVRYSFALVRSLSLSLSISLQRPFVCEWVFACFFFSLCFSTVTAATVCCLAFFQLLSSFFYPSNFVISSAKYKVTYTTRTKTNWIKCTLVEIINILFFLFFYFICCCFFLLLNSFIDRLSKSSNCHSASVFIYVCCLYCLCLVLFAPLTEIWKYALQSWRVQWTSNCSRLKNVCTCVCRSYFSSCINSSCILFALLTLWLSSVTLHRFFFYLAVFLLLLYLQQMCLPCKKRQCYGSKIKNAEKRYRSHCVPFCSSIPNECRNSTVELSSRSYLAATCPLALQIKTTQWKIKHTEHISIIISASQHQQFNSVECMFGVSDDETLCYRWIISNRIVRHFLRLNLSENVLNWMR